MTRRDVIIATISDLVADLLYYDRKEDDDLPIGAIESAINAGETSVAEVVAQFAASLCEGLVRRDD